MSYKIIYFVNYWVVFFSFLSFINTNINTYTEMGLQFTFICMIFLERQNISYTDKEKIRCFLTNTEVADLTSIIIKLTTAVESIEGQMSKKEIGEKVNYW